MSDPYDTLMDHLATLAVAAVQCPSTAVHAYWLMRFSHQEVQVTCLPRDNDVEAQPNLPEWARPYALQALQHLLQQGLWCRPCLPATPGSTRRAESTAARHQPTWHWQPICWQYLDEISDYTSRIWEAAHMVHAPRQTSVAALPEDVWRGAALFDAGLYFACHEYFETFWGRTADPASDFYQGLIQIAVAMQHLTSHNVRGAIILLRAGIGRLQGYPAIYKGLQVAVFLDQLAPLLHHLETYRSPIAYQFEARQVPRLLVQPTEGA